MAKLFTGEISVIGHVIKQQYPVDSFSIVSHFIFSPFPVHLNGKQVECRHQEVNSIGIKFEDKQVKPRGGLVEPALQVNKICSLQHEFDRSNDQCRFCVYE